MDEITVILSAYNRIENLEHQIEAIKNQTIKPAKIFLFQDGIATGEKVTIPEETLKKFDLYEISEENKGVWARFDFAKRNVQTKYVCIFDDDTIPGKKWLENCLTEMNKREGIYGAIGIIMQNPEDYPFKNYVRAGWAAPCKKTMPVDFVGHSWFFKKEWLNLMFDGTEELQALKYAGEDMTLSAMAQIKYGVQTFVPPHPLNDKEMWGSDYDKAISLGNKNGAISHNNDNSIRMNKGMNLLLKKGYKPLCETNSEYAKKMKSASKLAKNLTRIILNKKTRHSLRLKLIEKFYTKEIYDKNHIED